MLLAGNIHNDERGIITYNNAFDASIIKRIYTIENHSTDFIRGWQGHKIEQRWFAAMRGSFKVSVICIDDFENPSIDLVAKTYILTTEGSNIHDISAGTMRDIQTLDIQSK